MIQNRIDTFEFLSLVGNPEPLKRQVELLARAGVDGVTAVRTGARGVRFTLQSRVDAADRAAARSLFLSYRNLIGQDPVELVWYDLPAIAEEFRVLVLDVRPVAAKSLLSASGGLNPPGLGFVVCDWDLVAVGY